MTDHYEDDEIVINADFSEKKPQEKETGVLGKMAAYVKKNRAAEAERRKKTGEPSFSEEISKFGSEWGKNLTKGMADVGTEEEAKLNGKKKQSTPSGLGYGDDSADEFLFGKYGKKQPPQSTTLGGTGGGNLSVYTEKEFIDKLCEFLRYVAEDDDVGMYQYRNKQYMQVDYKYLSKLLTRYLGHKITLKERDLSFK
jgi:hypothetical protein